MFVSYTPGDRLVLAKNPRLFRARPAEARRRRTAHHPGNERQDRRAAGRRHRRRLGPAARPGEAARRQRGDCASTASPPRRGTRAIMNNLDPAVQRSARAARLPHGRGQARRGRADAVRPRRADHQPDPADPPVLRQATSSSRRADPAGARKLLAEAGHPNGIKRADHRPGRARRCASASASRCSSSPSPPASTSQVQRVPFSSYDAEVSGKAPLYIDGYFARPTIDTSTYPVPA